LTDRRPGRLGGFGQRGLGDLQVQLDQLLDAFEGLVVRPKRVSRLAFWAAISCSGVKGVMVISNG
jgi:hypothetical protein